MLSTFFPIVGVFICMMQCVSDTLNAPADKLLLSKLSMFGGHSAISGCKYLLKNGQNNLIKGIKEK